MRKLNESLKFTISVFNVQIEAEYVEDFNLEFKKIDNQSVAKEPNYDVDYDRLDHAPDTI